MQIIHVEKFQTRTLKSGKSCGNPAGLRLHEYSGSPGDSAWPKY
jgi:hypothetical protein